MKTTIGGDRLGSGNKQNISVKNFKRSTHDLSYIWRSSMSAGTLVPFMSELALPGDNFDIKLNCNVLTLPTVGPVFGKYKVQLDVFSTGIRLYQGKLHMNALNIGMQMDKIKLPQIEVKAFSKGNVVLDDNEHINPSSILSYLNIRGLGTTVEEKLIKREFNAVPLLAYWDIYKQYYANKQEENGVMIHNNLNKIKDFDIVSAEYRYPTYTNEWSDIYTPNTVDLLFNEQNKNDIQFKVVMANGFGEPDLYVLMIEVPGVGNYHLTEFCNSYDYDRETNIVIFNGLNLPNVGTYTCTIYSQDPDRNIPVYPIIVPTDGAPNLVKFPLDNIDDMRENLLINVKNEGAYVIKEGAIAPYGSPLVHDYDSEEDKHAFSILSTQEGLGIKTYQSDLFNNWISTEWIEGDNGINAVTSVDTSEGNFNIDALNLANKVYNMLNRIAISGGSYDDWLDAVYTHERSKSVENPVYQGSLIKELSFEEVVSMADTNDNNNSQPLGTLAGKGRLNSKNKGGKIKIKIDEPSYIMGIVSITPIVDYSQGNKWDMNLKNMNDFHKPALDEIGFQDLITDQMAWFDTECDENGNVVYKSAGKQPAWINYMTNVNQVRGTFAEKNSTMFMVLNRRYESRGFSGIYDLTTYIDPSKFNHIFADTRLDAQNFWVQISNNITARRKMSAKVIPNL